MSSLFDIKCPNCHSRQLITTTSDSKRMSLSCVACGHSFKASADIEDTKSYVQPSVQRQQKMPEDHEVASQPQAAAALQQRAVEIARTQGLLAAIQFLRNQSGWSLKQTKAYLEQRLASNPIEQQAAITTAPATASYPSERFQQELIKVAATQGKLQAVKFCRDRKGWGLRASVLYVEKVVPADGFKKRDACFVATACYGDYNATEVIVLRKYRDEVLMTTAMGSAFVKVYYAVGPALSGLIEGSSLLKTGVRTCILRPLVRRLQAGTEKRGNEAAGPKET